MGTTTINTFCAGVCATLVSFTAHGAECEPDWSALTGPLATGVNGALFALEVFDDGTGPALYAGGNFTIAGGLHVSRIARWNGSSWSALTAPGGVGVSSTVSAMAVFDDGSGPSLYVAGGFQTAGGATVNNIARWDGTSWSALTGPNGTGTIGSVNALAVFDDGTGPALYVGGSFNVAGGVQVGRIARWDGSAWSGLSGPSGTGVNNTVESLTVFDDGSGPALFVGGRFATAGGVEVNRIARWNGSTWSALAGPGGVGISGGEQTVHALAVFDDGTGPALHVGGAFFSAGGVSAFAIARWDGSTWSPLIGPGGGSVSSTVFALTEFDDGSGPALYAGGQFPNADGAPVNRIARWNGSAWSALSGPEGTGVGPGSVQALTHFDEGEGPALVAGGLFTNAGGVMVNRIARWDGSAWSDLSGPSGFGLSNDGPLLSPVARSLTTFDDGTERALYVGGAFDNAGSVPVNGIARWNGSTWSALTGPTGTGVGADGFMPVVFALTEFDDGTGPALYAGGSFATAGGIEVNRVARWDGTSWSALPGPGDVGVDGTVRALTVFDDGRGPALYAGGGFKLAGGVEVNGVARWDGSSWSALEGPNGVGISGDFEVVLALTVFDDGSGPALYAGGFFTSAGGVKANRIARWDGTNWSAVNGPGGGTVGDGVWALSTFDDGTGSALYAGGFFTTADGVTVNNLARWDGVAWSGLSGPSGIGVSSEVRALQVLNDRNGSALYAGGVFDSAGGVTVNRIARWDGSSWSALVGSGGTGTNFGGSVNALTAFDDGTGGGPALFVGGVISSAGGVTVNGIARWGRPCVLSPCPADVNGDGTVDLSDLLTLLGAWGPCGDCPTDLNGDGIVDLSDLLLLLAAWGECP